VLPASSLESHILMTETGYLETLINTVTNMTIGRQRLAKHVPDRYAVNKSRRPSLGNGIDYHGITNASDATTVLEPLKAVISMRISRSYKMRAVCQRIRKLLSRKN
jgi:hypothetical protein